jgi:hypothetical protein
MRQLKLKITAAIILLLTTFCLASSFSEQFESGNTILEINNLNDFVEFYRLHFMERETFASKEIHLKADIVIEEGFLMLDQRDVGLTMSRGFRGVFEGNGHYIKGLGLVPLFDRVRNAEIRNLNIAESNFGTTSIAFRSKNSTIDNVNVSASIVGRHVGGLFIYASGTTIKNSSFDGNIAATSRQPVGGIVSMAEFSSILNNNVSGTITANPRAITRDGVGAASFSKVADNNVSSEIIETLSPVVGLEFGSSFGFGDYGISAWGINAWGGPSINRHFSIALGTGIHWTFSARTNGITYTDLSDETLREIAEHVHMYGQNGDVVMLNTTERFVPIFLRPIFYSGKNMMTLILEADVGIAICRSSTINTYPSFYFSPAIGFEFIGMGAAFGHRMWTGAYEKYVFENGVIGHVGSAKRLNNSLFLRFGYSF